MTPAGQGSVFFKTEEEHARAMAIDNAGNLILGTEPGGLIFRVSPAGEGFVLHQAGAEPDSAKRCELYTQIDQIVSGDAIFLAPFRGTSTWFFQPNVRGMKIVNQRIWNAIDQMYIAQ